MRCKGARSQETTRARNRKRGRKKRERDTGKERYRQKNIHERRKWTW